MPRKPRYGDPVNLKGSLNALILNSLRAGPSHGYRIAQEIKTKSKGLLEFKEGTLYPALHLLEEKGHIESFTGIENGRERCYYRLTQKGKKLLKEEKAQWNEVSHAITLILNES